MVSRARVSYGDATVTLTDPGSDPLTARAPEGGDDALVAELARRVENERALREIAARFAAITDPAVLLQYVVDEANRLVDGDGAILDVVQPGTRILAWAYDAGLTAASAPRTSSITPCRSGSA